MSADSEPVGLFQTLRAIFLRQPIRTRPTSSPSTSAYPDSSPSTSSTPWTDRRPTHRPTHRFRQDLPGITRPQLDGRAESSTNTGPSVHVVHDAVGNSVDEASDSPTTLGAPSTHNGSANGKVSKPGGDASWKVRRKEADCPEPYASHYCFNDGKCTWTGEGPPTDSEPAPVYCRCSVGFHGSRCEHSFDTDVYGFDFYDQIQLQRSPDHVDQIGRNSVADPYALKAARVPTALWLSVLCTIGFGLTLALGVVLWKVRRTRRARRARFPSDESGSQSCTDFSSSYADSCSRASPIQAIAYSNRFSAPFSGWAEARPPTTLPAGEVRLCIDGEWRSSMSASSGRRSTAGPVADPVSETGDETALATRDAQPHQLFYRRNSSTNWTESTDGALTEESSSSQSTPTKPLMGSRRMECRKSWHLNLG